MATANLRAVAVIEGKDRSSAAFASAERRLKRLQAQARQTEAVMGAMNRLVAVGGAAFAGIGLGNMAQESVTRFAAVERQLNRVGITGDATAKQMGEAAQNLRQLAYNSGLSFRELSAGLEAGVASGDKLDTVMDRMPHYAKVTQATGAAMDDVVKTGTALGRHLGISANGMAEAFDKLAVAGKEGEFEFKDMANYLPKLLPMAKAIGYQGQSGVEKIGALLQTIRAATGTSEEAANALENILSKMESKETAKNFKEMGVDLTKRFEEARKKGDDLVKTFLKAAADATKGDLSKLPQLIADLQFGKGTRGLLQLPETFDEVMRKMRASKGTVDSDFRRIIGDTQTKIDQTKETIVRFTTALGSIGAMGMSSSGLTAGLQAAAERLENAAREFNQRGIARTVANIPNRGGGFWSDLWDELKQNLSEVGPQEIEGMETGQDDVAKLKRDIDIQRTQLAELERSNKAFAPEQAARIRKNLAENEGKVANAQAGAQWRSPYKPLDHTTIMGQMPIDAYEEHSRRRGTLEKWTKGKRVNVPLPEARPDNFGFNGVSALDLDVRKIEPALNNARQAFEQMSASTDDTKSKAAEIVTEVQKIGPAGQQAGQQVASAADAFLAKWTAAIDVIQTRLNNMKGPNLGAAAGAGIGARFNTGSSSGGTD